MFLGLRLGSCKYWTREHEEREKEKKGEMRNFDRSVIGFYFLFRREDFTTDSVRKWTNF